MSPIPEKANVRVDVQLELHVPGITLTGAAIAALDEDSHQRVDDLVHQLLDAADPSRHYGIGAWVRSTKPITEAETPAAADPVELDSDETVARTLCMGDGWLLDDVGNFQPGQIAAAPALVAGDRVVVAAWSTTDGVAIIAGAFVHEPHTDCWFPRVGRCWRRSSFGARDVEHVPDEIGSQFLVNRELGRVLDAAKSSGNVAHRAPLDTGDAS